MNLSMFMDGCRFVDLGIGRWVEIAVLFSVFHGCFGEPVVEPGSTAFANFGGQDVLDDIIHGDCQALYGGGTGSIADGAEAHIADGDFIFRVDADVFGDGEQLAAGGDHTIAGVGEINIGQFDLLAADVVPDVEFGPVGNRENAHIFAFADGAVVDVPKFGSLPFGVPGAEFVADAENAFLGAGFFLVAPGAADAGVKFKFFDGFQQSVGLQGIAARVFARPVLQTLSVDGILDLADDEFFTELGRQPVAVFEHFGEIMTSIDVHQRKRKLAGAESLFGQFYERNRILAAGEQQPRSFELAGYFAQDVNGLGFQVIEVIKTFGHIVRQ